MAEFAYGPTGHNYHDGHCRNPWNTAHVTGGSSSGSGSSVAARAGFAALGSDTGGSIRLPAAICGITGLKVTYGRVSRAGAMPLSLSMDTVGPLARSAQDCALLLGALAGADPADPTAATEPIPDYAARLALPAKGMRVGIPMSYFTDDMDPGVGAALTEGLKALESLGCEIVPVTLPAEMAAIDVAGTHVIAAEAAAYHGNWLRTRPQDYSPQVRARLERGLALPATRYIDALRLRGHALAEFSKSVFAKVDVLHAPCLRSRRRRSPRPTWAARHHGPHARADDEVHAAVQLSRPAVARAAVRLPRERAAGGMQLVGRPFAEDVILRLGHAFQQATDWHKREPRRA